MHRSPAWFLLPLAMACVCACTSPVPAAKAPTGGPNAVVRENEKPGQSGWYKRESATGIAGYATATSVPVGGSLGIAVSTTSPSYSIDVFRLGWYHGAGARLLLSVRDLTGENRGQWQPGTFGVESCPTCTYDEATGLLQLGWPSSYTLTVPRSWLSGNFVARLSTPRGTFGYVPFIVREPRPSAVLAVMPVNTYQAYNGWGGKSLYSTSSFGPVTRGVGDNAPSALRVSFERPVSLYEPIVTKDYETVGFLEREGYDVTYAGSVDLDRDPALLHGHRVFLSVGHDEYWSRAARAAVESGRDHGMDAVFLGGNAIYWQVRYEPGRDGEDHEVLVCYRDASIDPVSATNPAVTTVRWVDPPVARAQDELTGTLYTGRVLARPTAWVVAPTAPEWLLLGSGLTSGGSIPDLVGTECDGVVTATSHPYGWRASAPPRSLVVVSQSPVVTASGTPLVCNTIYYRAAGGGQVFSAGTWSWQDFLNGPKTNAAVVRMTENVLAHLGAPVTGPG
jgi:hypothetical protein